MLYKLLPAVLVGVIAAAIPVFADGGSGADRPAARSLPANLDLGVFKRRATAADRLPRSISGLQLARQIQVVRAGDRLVTASRFVGRFAGFRFFVVPGRDQHVCIFGTGGSGRKAVAFGSCSPADSLQTGMITTGVGVGDGVALAGVVADGFESATLGRQAAPVVGNVFFLTAPTSRFDIRLEGAGMTTRVRQLDFSAD